MADTLYTIVLNADTIVILKNPILDFAPWQPQVATATGISVEATNETDTTGLNATALVTNYAPLVSLFRGDSVADRSAVAFTAENTENITSNSKDNGDTDDQVSKALPAIVRHHCSSAHLKVASKVFDKAISGDWAESARKDDGYYHNVVEDWAEDALLVLLNVLHSRYKEVPLSVDIEMLAKLATLIDYYQCGEATAMCTEKWIGDVLSEDSPPTTYNRTLILWMCVACIFRLKTEFWSTTKTVINKGHDGSLRTLGLPIPQSVSGKSRLPRTRTAANKS